MTDAIHNTLLIGCVFAAGTALAGSGLGIAAMLTLAPLLLVVGIIEECRR